MFLKKTINIVHIHNDIKFISDSKNFDGEYFNNTIIYLHNRCHFNNYNDNSLINFNFRSNIFHLKKIIKICNKSDVVVLYGLDIYKAYLSNRIQKKVKIVWRFFGSELYHLRPQFYLSNLTLHYISKSKIVNFNEILSSISQIFKQFLIGNCISLFNIQERIKNVDLVLMLMKEEYDDLKQHFIYLPKFIEIPYLENPINQNFLLSENKKNQIIIGNNMSHFNNHLEIVKIIRDIDTSKKYNFIFPLSYNQTNSSYSRELLKLLNTIENATTLRSMISLKEYTTLIGTSKALIQNSYRQMGVGNIKLAIISGVKDYLNPKNVVYTHLVKKGFYIETTNNFEQDLKDDNISLTQTQINNNIEKYMSEVNFNNTKKFQQKIINELFPKHISKVNSTGIGRKDGSVGLTPIISKQL